MSSLDSFLHAGSRPGIVAILNVTPDSFFDGGRYGSIDSLVARAAECIQEGADILELGAESTGPKSPDVTAAEEKNRLLPALDAVRKSFPNMPISIDTYKADVAEAALNAGATLINDVTAGRGDARMFEVIAAYGCPVVLMHSKDPTARTTVAPTQYENVIAHIRSFLQSCIDVAVAAGIDRKKIIVDPGLGHFVSSDPKYSFEILERLQEIAELGPVLLSPSRKSFLAGPKDLPAAERLPATLDASLTAVKNGARFIRTHDIAETHQILLTLTQSTNRRSS